MGVVVSFTNYTPSPRYDGEPWTQVRIEEATAEDGTYTGIETINLSPVDSDPTDPQARSFTTSQGTDVELWYRVVFVDGDGDESEPSSPVQNVASSLIASTPYATTDELFGRRFLNITNPTAAQLAEGERVLSAAAGEIDSELDRAGDALQGWQISLASEVNLERAVEHWRDGPFGLVGLGDDLGTLTHTARNSWERYAHKLAPLKGQWGLA